MNNIDTFVSAMLGVVFAILGTATTFLMFWLWGFPFDKARRLSSAPKPLMYFHRALGFVFVAIYVFMMIRMVPRMLAYQVEFPPRTVAHMCLAIAIGVILLVKVSIIRFFRHLEEWMPVLGVVLLLCTWMLVGLSVPFSIRERQLAQKGDAFAKKNLERVALQLGEAGLPKEASVAELASVKALLSGRSLLLTKCVVCHDLRTVLTKPRTPSDWAKTVERMGERPVIGDVITDREQWAVTAYLVAISPELHNAAGAARKQKQEKADSRTAAKDVKAGEETPVSFRKEAVKPKFDKLCTQCHELDDVDKHVFKDEKDCDEVMSRMVDNGLECSADELKALRWYLVETYLKKH
jgi:cytochrome c5